LVASAKVAAATQKMEAELAPGLKVELEKKDKELERKDKEVKDASERLESMQKDFSNFRNRVKMDVDLSVNRAREEWLRKVLGVADNFERALSASRDPKAIEALLKGIEMIQAQLMDILEAEGVKEIPTEGQPFDPRLHDALQQEVTAEHPDDTVLKALQKGYTINGKVLRPAMVQTSRLPPGVTYQPPGPNGKPKTAEVETRNEKPASADAADKLAPVEKVEKLVETPKMAEKPAANAPVEEVKVAVPEPSVLPADLLEQLPLAEEPAVETTPKPVVEPGEAELEDWFAHRLSNS
jgi:molecular chaperone GrpE